MSLNDVTPPPSPPAPASPGRSVPLTWVVVGILVVAGAAIVGTAAILGRSSSSPGAVTVTDDLGRTVSSPYDPARVVVLGPSIMDDMYRLGLRNRVVGVDCYTPIGGGLSADYSSDQVALWTLSGSMCVQIGPSFDFESLLNATPQLVLASTIVSQSSVESISTTYHIPVVMLQPPTLSGVLVDLTLLGTIFGVAPAAAALNAQLSTELANASAIQQTLYSFPTVLVTYDTDLNGYWTFGPGTFGESLIELAGGANVNGANSTFPYPELSGEQVLVANPQYIIVGTGFGLNVSSYSGAPFWTHLGAVQNGNVTGMDSNWMTEPDPTMILQGLPAMIAILHPTT
ncbi:MAG: ABC transporter substrate-binding protein [Thermoplasmata archaeon]|nr:ABC transporter substrate-binding protein [Thermoplasmata archaeon]